MNNSDKRPDPKPRKHPQLWQSYLWWDELVQMRKRHNLRVSSIEAGKSNMDAQIEYDIMEHMDLDALIRLAKRQMVNYGKAVGPIWDAMTSIRGLGEGGLAAQLLAQIDDIGKFATISKLWRFSGNGLFEYWHDGHKVMAPRVGYKWTTQDGKRIKKRIEPKPKDGWSLKTISDRRLEGWHSPFNATLRSITYLIGDQFIRQQTPAYVELYYREKDELRTAHPDKSKLNGRWMHNDGHIHNMARRKAVKIFLQHLWLVWRSLEGLPVSRPYVHDRMGHGTIYTPEEFGWAVEARPVV